MRARLATPADMARLHAADEEVDGWTRRPRGLIGVFAVVARRPPE